MSPSLPPGFGIMLCYWGMPCKPMLSCLHWTVWHGHCSHSLLYVVLCVPGPGCTHSARPASRQTSERERGMKMREMQGRMTPARLNHQLDHWLEHGVKLVNSPVCSTLTFHKVSHSWLDLQSSYNESPMYLFKWFNRAQSIQLWFGIHIYDLCDVLWQCVSYMFLGSVSTEVNEWLGFE